MYKTNKQNYIDLKSVELDVDKHEKKYFFDSTILPQFQFGNKNTAALTLPHASTSYIHNMLDYSFDGIKKYSKIIMLTTNHNDKNNYLLDVSKIRITSEAAINVTTMDIQTNIKSLEHFYTEHSFLSCLSYIHKFQLASLCLLSIGNKNQHLIDEVVQKIDDDTLLIANTDLLHCGENYGTVCPNDIMQYNRNIVKSIIDTRSNFTMQNRALKHWSYAPTEICGYACIQTFLEICKSIKYKYAEHILSTSNGLEFELKSSNVGYTSIIFNKTGEPNIAHTNYLKELPLIYLNNYFNGTMQSRHFELYMNQITGLFVTLKKNKQLRGCIGKFALTNDVIQSIYDMTSSSAFHDNRFNSLDKNEMNDITAEVNFLQKPFDIEIDQMYSVFQVGKHGLIAYFSDGLNATYLADVFIEHFNIKTAYDLKTKFDIIIESLKNKVKSTGKLKRIQLYICTST